VIAARFFSSFTRISLLVLITLQLSIAAVQLPAQSDGKGEGGGNETIAFLPTVNRGSPAFAPLLIDRLVDKIFSVEGAVSAARIEAPGLETMSQEEIRDLSPQAITAFLLEKGREGDARYTAAAGVRKEGSTYTLEMYIVDNDTGETVVEGSRQVDGVGDVDLMMEEFRNDLLRSEYPAVAQRMEKEAEKAEEEREAAAEDTDEREAGEETPAEKERKPETAETRAEEKDAVERDAGERDAGERDAGEESEEKGEKELEELEKLAEEDPEKAVEKLPPKVKEKLKKNLRPEVEREVEEDKIKELYEEDKERRRHVRRRRIAFWTAAGGYSLRLAADLGEHAAEHMAYLSLKEYGEHLAGGPYHQYREFNDSANGMAISSYVMSTISAASLGADFLLMPEDTLRCSPLGRTVLAVSTGLYTFGRSAALISGIAGTYSMRRLFDYQLAGTDTEADSAYTEYRTAYELYAVERIVAYSLEGAGLIGTLGAFFLPGEKQDMIRNPRQRVLLGAGSIMSGAASMVSKMAFNFYEQAAQYYYQEAYGGSAVVTHTYEAYGLTAQIISYTLFAGAAGLTVWGVLGHGDSEDRADEAESKSSELALSVSCTPAPEGGMRLACEVWW
jgi:hypothetical protein